MNEMTQAQQIDQLVNELDILINRFAEEYDLPYATTIGVLQLKIIELANQAADDEANDHQDAQD